MNKEANKFVLNVSHICRGEDITKCDLTINTNIIKSIESYLNEKLMECENTCSVLEDALEIGLRSYGFMDFQKHMRQ